MKTLLITAAVLCVATIPLSAEEEGQTKRVAKEEVVVVKMTDMTNGITHEVMSPEEFKIMQKDLYAERRVFSAAMTAAKYEWRKNKEEYGNKSFPTLGVKPRRADMCGSPTTDIDRAMKKAENYQFYVDEKALQRAKREEEMKKQRSGSSNRGRSRNSFGVTRGESATQKLREKKKEDELAEKKALMEQGLALFEAKLAEKVEGATTRQEPKAAE